MPIKLYIPKRQLSGLATIRRLGSDKLQRVIEQIGGLDHPLDVGELEAAIESEVGKDTAIEFLQQLLGISGLARHRDLQSEEVFEGLTRGLRDVSGDLRWSKKELQEWEGLKDQIVLLLGLTQVHVVSKALSLSYDYENLLQNIRILTDIRPVFDEERERFEGAVISQTLRVRYDSGNRTHTLSLAIDAKDLEHLRRSCELAAKKAEHARRAVEEKMGIPVLIPGENDNDE